MIFPHPATGRPDRQWDDFRRDAVTVAATGEDEYSFMTRDNFEQRQEFHATLDIRDG